MSNRNKKSIEEVTTHKKAEVLGTEKKKKLLPYTVIAICAILVMGALILFQGKGLTSQNQTVADNKGSDDKGAGQGQVVTYPVTLFDDGSAKHFEYAAGNGMTIKYFILKSSDGVIRAAFDACDVCWPSGKGYYQEQDVMVCRNCGRRFASVKINEVKGGCNPAPLMRRIDGGNLVIQVADILKGKAYFDFSGRGNS